MDAKLSIRFWGVRGSVPSPIGQAGIRRLIQQDLGAFLKNARGGTDIDGLLAQFVMEGAPLTFGGNTSCVEIRYGNRIYVLDMGTGLREFGNSLIPEMFAGKGLHVTFLNSHVHWDHIQGLPFFGPIYVNKETGIQNAWTFYGGTDWQATAEVCFRHQFNPPTFPVTWAEIAKITHRLELRSVYDRMTVNGDASLPTIEFGKLNHPQDTYGIRFVTPEGIVVVYTTDNEPYDPTCPDPRLLRLAQDADLWITDCQYTKDVYEGRVGGVPRHGWGHSYPEAVAATAVAAKVKRVVLFHHDPVSDDPRIRAIALDTQALIDGLGGFTRVVAAYEGLRFTAGDTLTLVA